MQNYIYFSKKGLIVATNNSKASVFSIANNLVFSFSENIANYALELQKEFARKAASPKALAKALPKTANDVFVAGKSLTGLKLYRVDRKGNIHEEPCAQHFQNPSLEEVAKLYTKGKKIQFGVLSKTGSAILQNPNNFPSTRDSGINSKLYSIVSNYLGKRTNTNPGTEELDKALFNNLFFYASSKNILDRIELGFRVRMLENQAKKYSAKSKKTISSKCSSIDDVLSSILKAQKSQKTSSIILKINKPKSISSESFYDLKQELFACLNQQFSISGHVFKYAGYLGITCESRDAQKLLKIFDEKSPRYFSQKKGIIESIIGQRGAHTVFTPELAMAIRKRKARGRGLNNIICKPVIAKQDEMWNLENIHTYEAWASTKGKKTTIAVIDTGTDYNHPELKSGFGVIKGYNFIENSLDPMDGNSHGTHVAGTIAGKTVGVAPEATLVALKILNDQGFGSEFDANRALEFCIDSSLYIDQKIIIDSANMSFGCPVPSDIQEELCDEAARRGVLLVAAAGNEERGYSYPAAYYSVISVAAVDRYNKHPDFSNIADTNDLSAPGVEIYSCLPDNNYGLLTGTSMATPHITGAASLSKSLDKKIDIDGFREIIEGSTIPLGNRSEYGAGLIQLDELVENI